MNEVLQKLYYRHLYQQHPVTSKSLKINVILLQQGLSRVNICVTLTGRFKEAIECKASDVQKYLKSVAVVGIFSYIKTMETPSIGIENLEGGNGKVT